MIGIGLARRIKDQVTRGIECRQAFRLQQCFAAGCHQRRCLNNERHLEHTIIAGEAYHVVGFIKATARIWKAYTKGTDY